MATYIYLLFFLSLNLYIYLYLNKIIVIKSLLHFLIISLFLAIILVHEFELIPHQIKRPYFNRIFFFSYLLVFFYFLNKFMINRISKKKSFNAFNSLIAKMIEKKILVKFIFVINSIIQIQLIYDLK